MIIPSKNTNKNSNKNIVFGNNSNLVSRKQHSVLQVRTYGNKGPNTEVLNNTYMPLILDAANPRLSRNNYMRSSKTQCEDSSKLSQSFSNEGNHKYGTLNVHND